MQLCVFSLMFVLCLYSPRRRHWICWREFCRKADQHKSMMKTCFLRFLPGPIQGTIFASGLWYFVFQDLQVPSKVRWLPVSCLEAPGSVAAFLWMTKHGGKGDFGHVFGGKFTTKYHSMIVFWWFLEVVYGGEPQNCKLGGISRSSCHFGRLKSVKLRFTDPFWPMSFNVFTFSSEKNMKPSWGVLLHVAHIECMESYWAH